MDGERFDRLVRSLTTLASRRRALGGLLLGSLGGVLVALMIGLLQEEVGCGQEEVPQESQAAQRHAHYAATWLHAELCRQAVWAGRVWRLVRDLQGARAELLRGPLLGAVWRLSGAPPQHLRLLHHEWLLRLPK